MIGWVKKYFTRKSISDKDSLYKRDLKEDIYKFDMTTREVTKYFKYGAKDESDYYYALLKRYDTMKYKENIINKNIMEEVNSAIIKTEIDKKLHKYYKATAYVTSGQPKKYVTDTEIRSLIEKNIPIRAAEIKSFGEYIDLKHHRSILKILKEFDRCRIEKIRPNKDLIDRATKLIKHIELEIKFKKLMLKGDELNLPEIKKIDDNNNTIN